MSRVSPDLQRIRLRNQRLAGPRFRTPAEVVGWFGAVQAQEYAAARWAVALRTRSATEIDVERAFDAGEILRTHVLRPTWHFVLPEDLRWMQALTAPRVRQAMAFHDRYYGVRTANGALAKALANRRYLTRSELEAVLRASGQKLAGILIRAEIDAVICSGPRRGKQFTYAPVDERCPPASPLSRDEALGRLAITYFRGHGPALPQDFAWWSGLTVADARRAIEIAGLEPRDRYYSGSWSAAAGTSAVLLPNFDECFVGYRVRERRELSAALIVDGFPGEPRTAAQRRAVAEAKARYAAYKK